MGRPRKTPPTRDALIRAQTIAELKRKLDDEYHRALREARAAGESLRSIGEAVGLHPEAVRRLLQEDGSEGNSQHERRTPTP